MDKEKPDTPSPSFWENFISQIAKKTRSNVGKSSKLKRAISNAPGRPDIYITLGVHGNILFSDIGYCEFDSPERVWNFIQKWAILSAKLPIAFEIGVCSLEQLAKKYPVWDLFREHNSEIINPTYSQPYLRHIGEEANIRQIKYGLDLLEHHNISYSTYASSEHALHPQIPQLLKGFGINQVFATVRLAGGAPTSYLPKIHWTGLDSTEIQCVVNQTGISNGQIWHGKFFQELPHLLFSAYSRPDLSWFFFENIEDVAYDFPELPEIAEHQSEFERSNIHFSKFADIFTNNYPDSRSVQWMIEDFPIRLMNSRLISEARICEDKLINLESSMALLSIDGVDAKHKFFRQIWKNVLIAQNHDAYIVPNVTPGMYMMSQGLDIDSIPSGLSIEMKSLEMFNLARAQLKLLKKKKTALTNTHEEAYVNWLWKRNVLEGDKLISLPAFGYKKTSGCDYKVKKFPSKGFRSAKGIVEWIDLPEIENILESKQMLYNDTTITLEDHHSYLILKVQSKKTFEFPIRNCEELVITFPFGAQKTSESFGHSHRFYWINKKLVICHEGCPYFTREGNNLNITIPKGKHKFGFGTASSLKTAYRIAWEFFYPPLKLRIPKTWEHSRSMISQTLNDYVPTSLRRIEAGLNMRGFCIGNKTPQLDNWVSLDLNDKPIDLEFEESKKITKWKILSNLIKKE